VPSKQTNKQTKNITHSNRQLTKQSLESMISTTQAHTLKTQYVLTPETPRPTAWLEHLHPPAFKSIKHLLNNISPKNDAIVT